MIEKVLPKSHEHWLQMRAEVITSTEISCLFGFSPYETPFELWHRKLRKEVLLLDKKDNERMFWGSALQDAIGRGYAERFNETVTRDEHFYRDLELKQGASIDFLIGKEGLGEVKVIDYFAFKQGWIVDDEGNIEAPLHIEMQVQKQMKLTKKKFTKILALVGGNTLKVLHREPDRKVFKAIDEKTEAFWKSIDDRQEPTPNYLLDAEIIGQLYGFPTPGLVMDAKGNAELKDLVLKYQFASENSKQFENEKKALKAEIMMKIGDNERVVGDGFTINASRTKDSVVEAHTREGFRQMRITNKEDKKLLQKAEAS